MINQRILQLSMVWLLIVTITGAAAIFATPVMKYSIAEVRYLAAGTHLAAGNGLVTPGGLQWENNGELIPFTHGPPLLALWIAATSTLPWMWSVKLLNVLSLVGIVVLTIRIAQRLIPQRQFAPLLALALLSLPNTTYFFFTFNTEVPFFFFLLLYLYFGIRYFADRQWRDLVIMAIAAGLAFLTRYAGLPLLAAGALMILYTGDSLPDRLRQTSVFAFISGLPTGIFLLANTLNSGDFGNREFAYHPMRGDELGQLLLVAVMGAVLAGVILRFERDANPGVRLTVLLIGLLVVLYAAFIALTGTFFDAATPVDDRILSPVYIMLLLLLGTLFAILPAGFLRRFATVLTVCLVIPLSLLLFVSNIGRLYSYIDASADATTVQISELASDAIIYTNRPDTVYIRYTDEPYAIPAITSPFTGAINPSLDSEMDTIRDDLANCDAMLLYYDSTRTYLMDENTLMEQLALDMVAYPIPDATAYIVRDCPHSLTYFDESAE